MRNHWITKSCFRICSSYPTRSQAGLWPYPYSAVSIRAKPTLELLRYFLGGDRPSQTAHLTVSLSRLHGVRLDLKYNKGGISPLANHRPKPVDHRLPPILRIRHLGSLSGYSKGSRGLSVLPRDCGIFTTTPISPSLPLRHWSSDYAIHARQNLPDKELRSVVVAPAWPQGRAAGWSFPPSSACRHAARTISSPP